MERDLSAGCSTEEPFAVPRKLAAALEGRAKEGEHPCRAFEETLEAGW